MHKRAYIKRTKLSNYKIKQIVRYFLTDLTATQTGKLLDLNRNTVNRFFNLIRDSLFVSNTLLLALDGPQNTVSGPGAIGG